MSDDCTFSPEGSTEGPCEGDVEEEWVDDGGGDSVAQYRCRAHSYYMQLDGLSYDQRVEESRRVARYY